MKKRRFNWSMTAGVGIGLLVVCLAVFHSTSTPWIFMNIVGFLIVGGGLAGASLMMCSFEDLFILAKDVWSCIYKSHEDIVVATEEIVKLAEKQSADPLFFFQDMAWVTHTLIRDGVEILGLGLKPDEIRKRLELIAKQSYERSFEHSGLLLSLAKLGPGFGLLGTLLGLVVLLQEMGSSGNMDHVGPALAISLLATLYGVIFANLLFQPLAEYIRIRGEQRLKIDHTIIDGILMIKEKRHPLQIRDGLRNHLSWKDNLRLNKSQKKNVKGSDKSKNKVEEAA